MPGALATVLLLLALAAIARILIVRGCPGRRAGATRVVFEFDPPVERTPGMLRLTITEQATARAKFTSAAGEQRPIDGVPRWQVDDEGVALLDVAPDGRSAKVISQAPGTTRVFVTADANLDEGVTEIVGSFDVEVVADPAVNVVFEFDAPEPKGS